MQYLSTIINIEPYSEEASDCLSALLGEIGYDTFEPVEDGLKAYIQKELFDEAQLQMLIEGFFLPVLLSYTVEEMENKDWNEEWEREHFDPVLEREFGIRLDPKMAFGSGSHETTHQLVSLLMSMDFSGQMVLDMGCGTGVLGIAMAKCGARHVTAIDIDDMSVENTKLNFSLNGLDNYTALLGDAAIIEGTYDTVVANIFKSVLIHDMAAYCNHLRDGGTIIFSGFYSADAPDIISAAAQHGLSLVQQLSENDWTVLVMKKERTL